jgi:uncharacterized protein YjgD (DUF1641 family)
MEKENALLHEKVDHLTAQVELLTRHAEQEQRRRREMEELKEDLIPIGNQMVKLTIDELAEIDTEFELEDLLYLLKRMLRNTQLILTLFDRVEALMDLADEAELLGRQVFTTSVEGLDRLEREGYFDFARESWLIVDRVVAEFDQEDVRALGENIVTILNTVRNMTQPEVMGLMDNAVGALQQEGQAEPPSLLTLIREVRKPEVRLGLYRLLNVVKAVSPEAAAEGQIERTNRK